MYKYVYIYRNYTVRWVTEALKMYRPLILFNGLALCIWSVGVFCVTDWEFVILRIEHNTTNADIIDFDLRPIRVSQGVYAINGSIVIGMDMDDTNSVELKLYRSASGSSQFRATPFEIPKTTFYKFMTSIYVKMLQKDLLQCSNLPEHKDSFEKPLQKGTYVLNKCIMSNDGMPGHIQPGIYRASGHLGDGGVELYVSIFFEVITKSMV
ncbi:uncharacterized protein LOC129939878 [Eupeodes corollae]|uniref:uncharacterized protein LOC129939878 n=1 Tax=Eupeodes corollae TaxID=290404 RepID=UPI002492C557|nr:uncharacterized protein LOC129939878 [Eupeodes corollae]